MLKLVWPEMGIAGLVALILAGQVLLDGSGPSAEARSVASPTGYARTVDEPSRPLPTQVDTQADLPALVETFDPGTLGSLVDAVELRVQLPEPEPAAPVAQVAVSAVVTSPVPAAPAVVAPAVALQPVVPTPQREVSATAAVAASGSLTLSASSVYEIALGVSGSESWAAWASRVAGCESGYRINAVGGRGEAGLMQLHPVHFGRWDRELLLTDPAYNLAAAYQLYQSTGPGAWSCA